jgi:hypothetical protein
LPLDAFRPLDSRAHRAAPRLGIDDPRQSWRTTLAAVEKQPLLPGSVTR